MLLVVAKGEAVAPTPINPQLNTELHTKYTVIKQTTVVVIIHVASLLLQWNLFNQDTWQYGHQHNPHT